MTPQEQDRQWRKEIADLERQIVQLGGFRGEKTHPAVWELGERRRVMIDLKLGNQAKCLKLLRRSTKIRI